MPTSEDLPVACNQTAITKPSLTHTKPSSTTLPPVAYLREPCSLSLTSSQTWGGMSHIGFLDFLFQLNKRLYQTLACAKTPLCGSDDLDIDSSGWRFIQRNGQVIKELKCGILVSCTTGWCQDSKPCSTTNMEFRDIPEVWIRPHHSAHLSITHLIPICQLKNTLTESLQSYRWYLSLYIDRQLPTRSKLNIPVQVDWCAEYEVLPGYL